MMPRVCSALCSLLFLVLCTASLDLSQIQVYPDNGGISGVFVALLKGQPYSFNATTAIDVCTRMGVSIATFAQVETAQSNGLQTCRYGWVMEKVAVVPRTAKNQNCGQNRLGTIVWRTPLSRLFDVFCFNSTGETEATTSTTPNWRTDANTTSPSFFLSTQLNTNKNFLGSSPSPQPISTGFKTTVITNNISFTVPSMTTKSSQKFPPSSSLTSAKYQLSSSSSFTTSFSSTDLSSHPFTNSSSITISSNGTTEQPSSGKGFYFGAVPIACVILVVMLLMMAGTGAVWYFKIKRPHRISPWERVRHEDMFETEMWKHTEQQHFFMQNDSENCGDDLPLQMEDDTISS